MSMDFKRKLPIPKEIKEQYPVTDSLAAVKAQRDRDIKAVFTGESDKFLLIIGPCSADNHDAVLDYLGRLKRVADEVKDKILIIPRVYTNKPRTTGEGYKGMLHQPNPEEQPDMLKGIVAIRQLHMQALQISALPVQTKCFIPKITVICPICSVMLLSVHARSKISNTALCQAVFQYL